MTQKERNDLEEWFNQHPFLGVKHYQGEGISIWDVGSGNMDVRTGDGGALLFKETLLKQMKEEREKHLKILEEASKIYEEDRAIGKVLSIRTGQNDLFSTGLFKDFEETQKKFQEAKASGAWKSYDLKDFSIDTIADAIKEYLYKKNKKDGTDSIRD